MFAETACNEEPLQNSNHNAENFSSSNSSSSSWEDSSDDESGSSSSTGVSNIADLDTNDFIKDKHYVQNFELESESSEEHEELDIQNNEESTVKFFWMKFLWKKVEKDVLNADPVI